MQETYKLVRYTGLWVYCDNNFRLMVKLHSLRPHAIPQPDRHSAQTCKYPSASKCSSFVDEVAWKVGRVWFFSAMRRDKTLMKRLDMTAFLKLKLPSRFTKRKFTYIEMKSYLVQALNTLRPLKSDFVVKDSLLQTCRLLARKTPRSQTSGTLLLHIGVSVTFSVRSFAWDYFERQRFKKCFKFSRNKKRSQNKPQRSETATVC